MKVIVAGMVILGIIASGFLLGYYEGDKHAACWVSDLETFQMRELPDEPQQQLEQPYPEKDLQ